MIKRFRPDAVPYIPYFEGPLHQDHIIFVGAIIHTQDFADIGRCRQRMRDGAWIEYIHLISALA
jgi:hypothetical protein